MIKLNEDLVASEETMPQLNSTTGSVVNKLSNCGIFICIRTQQHMTKTITAI